MEFRTGLHHGKIEKRTFCVEGLEEFEEIVEFKELKEFGNVPGTDTNSDMTYINTDDGKGKKSYRGLFQNKRYVL